MTGPPLASVVVPVWRDRNALDALLSAWAADPDAEVVVALPLGDRRAYRDLERRFGWVRWTEGPRGRAAQMNQGAAASTGRWLVFLHADSRLPADWLDVIRAADRDSDLVGGAFRFALDSRDWRARVLERAVRARVRLLDLPYGDQAIFARRSVFERLGGYRDLPLMEDVELVGRLRRAGALLYSSSPVMTSARRWQRDGWLRRSAGNMALAIRFRLGASPARLAQHYFHRSRAAVVVMARAPWTGGKTRIRAADDAAHAALREALFLDTLDAVRSVPSADHLVACDPAEEVHAVRDALDGSIDVYAQRGTSLGERLAHSFEDTFRLGYESVVIVGSDLPDLPREVVAAACAALADLADPVILGPASDGGYYLIGLNRPHPELFDGIDWGTDRVLRQTIAAAGRAGLPIRQLAQWSDVDDADDLARLAAAPRSEQARRTREWIRYRA